MADQVTYPGLFGTPWERYGHPRLEAIWYTPEGVGQFIYCHQMLAAIAEAQEEILPGFKVGTAAALRRVTVMPRRILEIQKSGENHQLRAFLKHVQEEMAENGDSEFTPWVHFKLTSFDLQDPATALMLVLSADILIEDLEQLSIALRELAVDNRGTLLIGRTHGIHGKPITFGKKCLDWLDMNERSIAQMKRAKDEVAVGKVSGAMGIYAQDPQVEEIACRIVGLRPARVSTQILPRDIFADFFHNLVLIMGRLSFMATTIRLSQQTERQELEEPFKSTGSSAMPHKRNAEVCEKICGLEATLRNMMGALYEMTTWDERSLEQSSKERLIFACIMVATGHAIRSMTTVLSGLFVNKDRMRQNILITNGAIFAEDIKTALQEKGIPQSQAYDLIKNPAQLAYQGRGNIIDNALAVPEIAALLSRDELHDLCRIDSGLTYIDQIYARFGL